MPGGVVFLVCIPTLSYEHELVFGVPLKRPKKIDRSKNKFLTAPKVDLRLKEVKTRTQLLTLDDRNNVRPDDDDDDDEDEDDDVSIDPRKRVHGYPTRPKTPVFVSMETVEYNQISHAYMREFDWAIFKTSYKKFKAIKRRSKSNFNLMSFWSNINEIY